MTPNQKITTAILWLFALTGLVNIVQTNPKLVITLVILSLVMAFFIKLSYRSESKHKEEFYYFDVTQLHQHRKNKKANPKNTPTKIPHLTVIEGKKQGHTKSK